MQNSIKLNNQEIELTPEQVAQIKEIVGIKKGLWKPKINYWYYCIDMNGDIMQVCFDKNNENMVNRIISIGNLFETRELAQKQVDKLKAIQRVKEYIVENDLALEPDWEDGGQEKSNIYYDFDEEEFDYNWYNCYKNYSPIGYLKSKEACNQLIEAKEDDLKIIWEI